MSSRVREYRHALLLVGAAACWGTATVISKRALAEFDPVMLLPIQLAVSVLVVAVPIGIIGQRPAWSSSLRRLGWPGVLNPGISYALSLAGLALITASLSVLLWAVEPLLIVLLARVALGERISPTVAAALVVAFGGVLLVVVESGSAGAPLGVVLTLAGVGACAMYTVLCSATLADDPTLAVVMVQQVFALAFAVALLTGAVVMGRSASLAEVSSTGWISALTSGILYYGVAFWFYLSGLRHVPAAVAGTFLNLIPVVGVTAGYLVLGERLGGRQWLGALTVLAAVTLVSVRTTTAATPAGVRDPA